MATSLMDTRSTLPHVNCGWFDWRIVCFDPSSCTIVMVSGLKWLGLRKEEREREREKERKGYYSFTSRQQLPLYMHKGVAGQLLLQTRSQWRLAYDTNCTWPLLPLPLLLFSLFLSIIYYGGREHKKHTTQAAVSCVPLSFSLFTLCIGNEKEESILTGATLLLLAVPGILMNILSDRMRRRPVVYMFDACFLGWFLMMIFLFLFFFLSFFLLLFHRPHSRILLWQTVLPHPTFGCKERNSLRWSNGQSV